MDWLRSKPASATGKAEKRQPHSIRFHKAEWHRIEAFAGDRGLTPSEFVRFATLAVIEGNDRDLVAKLAPLIETRFRATYVLMLKLKDDQSKAGTGDALETLVAQAQAMQDELLGGFSD